LPNDRSSRADIAVVDAGIAIVPDPRRLVVRFFVAGLEDVGPGDSRAGSVIDRILMLDDDEVGLAMASIDDRFVDRHPSLHATFDRHAERAGYERDPATDEMSARRLLVGAAFTHEYAVEGAALCNPSIVAHPVQPGNGDLAFVMSVRGIGEGHVSSIGFRTGVVCATGAIRLDTPGSLPRTGDTTAGVHDRGVLHRELAQLHDDHENAAYVLDALPEHFDDTQLLGRIAALRADAAIRRHTSMTIAHLEDLVGCSYTVGFAADSELSERVLWPHSPTECHGMEDARFVEITDDSGPRYCATYTAFDGAGIKQSLLTTDDFVTFAVSPMAGNAARGKGLALFPRQIDGRYAALTRADRETNSIAYSDDMRCWDSTHVVQRPRRAWEVLQLGNCGSPIETSDGWLVLTHGVGPMRTYSIGAILLDLDEPHRVIAELDRPFLTPDRSAGGYVPNVVYSCGVLRHGDRLVVPYGIGDQTIAIATLSVSELISAMQPIHTKEPR
jgi:predicted GH43/DUF377 family glycosyl hydrolase